jgi:hypothetical protein
VLILRPVSHIGRSGQPTLVMAGLRRLPQPVIAARSWARVGGVSRNIDRRAQGSDQGRYPPAKDRVGGGWPRGGARPRGVRESWIFRGGATFTPQTVR